MLLKGFSIFSSGGYFVQPSITILAYLVESHPRNISMKLFENWFIGQGAEYHLKVFLFLALAAILFIRGEGFYLFW